MAGGSSAVSEIHADRPIQNLDDDVLGRAPFAELIAEQISMLPREDCFVTAIQGPWGAGKTSLLNIIEHQLSHDPEALVVRFNPWLFSSQEQLIQQFFAELARQMGQGESKLAAVVQAIGRYASIVSPLRGLPVVAPVGVFAEVVEKLGEATREAQSVPVAQQRDEIDQLLADAGFRVVVMIDDIDRLSAAETREVFRLVRLVADFPTVVYVLAFDRDRVVTALDNEGGQEYLEKIIQVAYDLPELDRPTLEQMLLQELDGVIARHDHREAGMEGWADVFVSCVRPLVRTPRDVRRYANALPLALQLLGQEVALIDILSLTVVRVFLPAVFRLLARHSQALTSPHRGRSNSNWRHPAVEELIAAAEGREAVVRSFCKLTFPHTQDVTWGPETLQGWRRDCRVASTEVFRTYLQACVPSNELATADVEHVFALLQDEGPLEFELARMKPDQLEKLLGRLELYEQDFEAQVAEPAIRVLSRHYPRLRVQRRGFLDLGGDLAWCRVVLRLLRRVPADERVPMVQRLIGQNSSESASYRLVEIVGHREGVGHRLVSDLDYEALMGRLREQIALRSAEQLSKERDLPWLLILMGEDACRRPWLDAVLDEQGIVAEVLRASLVDSWSGTLGSAAQRHSYTLPWSLLVELAGEARLRQLVEHSPPTDDPRMVAALDLARGHLDSISE